MHEKLKTQIFSEYQKALDEVRKEVEDGKLDVDQDDFENIIKIYEWYKYDFSDIKDLTNKVKDIVEKNTSKMNEAEKKQYEGLIKYLKETLHHHYDGSGFPISMGNLETSALAALDKLIANMDKSYKDQLQTLDDYKKLLKRIEGCYHLSYRILKKIGNKYLDRISSFISSVPDTMQSYILHSLEEFKKDPNVADFFNSYLKKISHLKEEAENFLKNLKNK